MVVPGMFTASNRNPDPAKAEKEKPASAAADAGSLIVNSKSQDYSPAYFLGLGLCLWP